MAAFTHFHVEALDRPVKVRGCDCAGCGQAGEHRAPKHRDHLNDYYWFCIDHVREYNRQWDYFAGMSSAQIEDHVRSAGVWDRPSWPLGPWREREQSLRDQVAREFFGAGSGGVGGAASGGWEATAPVMPQAAREALALLELKPPLPFADIKAQYRVMVKRYHPDLHGGSREAEEKFKAINLAFTLLRQIYDETGQE